MLNAIPSRLSDDVLARDDIGSRPGCRRTKALLLYARRGSHDQNPVSSVNVLSSSLVTIRNLSRSLASSSVHKNRSSSQSLTGTAVLKKEDSPLSACQLRDVMLPADIPLMWQGACWGNFQEVRLIYFNYLTKENPRYSKFASFFYVFLLINSRNIIYSNVVFAQNVYQVMRGSQAQDCSQWSGIQRCTVCFTNNIFERIQISNLSNW